MKAPDKIYVLPEVASVVKVLDEEVEYIRKDALLEWAKDCIAEIRRSPNFNNDLATKCTMYAVFQHKLNSM